MSSELLNLLELADTLKLPAQWLKEQASSGGIPCLRVGRRFRFDAGAVRAALARRAAGAVAGVARRPSGASAFRPTPAHSDSGVPK